MERTLFLLSFALGGTVWLCGFLSSGLRHIGGSAPGALKRYWVVTSISLPVVVFLATLPVKPPIFSAGHGLGVGFLVGGLLGFLATWTIHHALAGAERGDSISAAGVIAAPIGLALMAAAVPSLWMRDSLLDALCGVAIGWLVAILLGLSSVASLRQARSISAASDCAIFCALGLAAGACTVFCALAGLGELRGLIDLVGKSTAVVHWSAPGLAFSACLSVLLLLVTLPASFTLRIPLVSPIMAWIERSRDSEESRAAARRGWRMGVSAIAALLVGRLVAARFSDSGDEPWYTKSPLLKPAFAILGHDSLFHVIALSVVAALLISWVVRDHARSTSNATGAGIADRTGLFAVFILAAAGMLAFQLMAGFGLCILITVLCLMTALSAAAPLAGLHERSSEVVSTATSDASWELTAANQMVRLVLAGATLALYRLFSARYESEIHGVGLTDHYALFGILLGVALPASLAGFLAREPAGASAGDFARLLRLAVTGLLVLVAPCLLITIWGAKSILALLIGLALSVALEDSLLSALLAIAVALALTQWAAHVLPLAQLTRDQKVNLLGWSTAFSIVAMLVAGYAGRWRATTGRGAPASAPSNGGAR